MRGGAPLAVVRAGWLRADDRMTLERAQAAFLAMYEAVAQFNEAHAPEGVALYPSIKAMCRENGVRPRGKIRP